MSSSSNESNDTIDIYNLINSSITDEPGGLTDSDKSTDSSRESYDSDSDGSEISRSTSNCSSSSVSSASNDSDSTIYPDKEYNNRAQNFYFGDRKMQATVDAMPEREFRELFRMTKRIFELLLFKLEDHIPLGLSSNGKSVSPRLMLLIFLYYVTGDIPARHLAVAAGVKKSKIRWICIQMVEIMIESGFLDEYIQLPTEDQGRYETMLLTRRSGMPEIFTGAVDGSQIDVWVKRREQKLFFNRYKRKAINVMAHGGITGLFYAMEASASGSCHDNAVFQGSILYNQLKNGNLPFEGAKIAGDAAYTVSFDCNF